VNQPLIGPEHLGPGPGCRGRARNPELVVGVTKSLQLTTHDQSEEAMTISRRLSQFQQFATRTRPDELGRRGVRLAARPVCTRGRNSVEIQIHLAVQQECWPCKSNPVRLGSSPRASTRVAGFRPGFWPQGQFNQPTPLIRPAPKGIELQRWTASWRRSASGSGSARSLSHSPGVKARGRDARSSAKSRRLREGSYAVGSPAGALKCRLSAKCRQFCNRSPGASASTRVCSGSASSPCRELLVASALAHR
jgi:hypothetical protein